MRAIEITSFGGPEVLCMAQRPVPQPAKGELLIQVTASGVNRPDLLQRKGLYPPPPGESDILGLEVAGVVVSGDESAMQAAGLHIGQRVCALVAGGGYAEYCVAPVAQTLPVPDGLSDVAAASLPETYFTVWSNLVDKGRLAAGEVLLVQGGSSGIGVAAIQLAKALGAQVIVTAGTDEKCRACCALGADHVINYTTQDFEAEVMRITQGRGVDVVLDMVAGDYVAKELQCLAEDGRLLIIAVLGGAKSNMNAALVLRKRLTISGNTLRARPAAFKAAIAKACRDVVWPWIAQGRIKPVVHHVFPADAVQQAHVMVENHGHIGKIVLSWSQS